MGSFSGMADIYEQSRHGYPPELPDHLVRIGALHAECVVADLGAGTGQLSMVVADLAANVVAIDPEPDMVRVGTQVTCDHPTIRWVVGSDSDVLEVLGAPIDLVLIGNAFHLMDQAKLLADLDTLVRPSGFVVVCSSSIPVWLQDTAWSAALREGLSYELGRPVGVGGTPDHSSDMAILRASSFSDVDVWLFEWEHQRSATSIVGEAVTSSSGAIDDRAAERLLDALDPYTTDGAVNEAVVTNALIARRSSD